MTHTDHLPGGQPVLHLQGLHQFIIQSGIPKVSLLVALLLFGSDLQGQKLPGKILDHCLFDNLL